MVLPLPKLNDDLCRVHIFRYLSEPADFDCEWFGKYLFMTIDIRCAFANELCVADHYIIDLGSAQMGHILKINFLLMKKAIQVVQASILLHKIYQAYLKFVQNRNTIRMYDHIFTK